MTHFYRFLILLLSGIWIFSSTITAWAQTPAGKYDLLFASGKVTPAENVQEFSRLSVVPAADVFQGYYFRLMQFSVTPTEAVRQKLEQQGLRLLGYFPNQAYFTAIPVNFDKSKLQAAGVRSVVTLMPENKMAESLLTQPLPNWALRGNNQIDLNLKYYATLPVAAVSEHLRRQNIQVLDQYDFSHVITVRVAVKDMRKVAALPYVFYVEPVDAPAEPENYRGRTNHRSNALSTEFSTGRKYDGSGVVVALGDDGIVGPHIDYQGRDFQAAVGSTNNGDHGDHVAGIIMGAGNLDPKGKGMAAGADLYVYNVWDAINRTPTTYQNPGVRITSTSYGNGCNAGYTSFAATVDQQIRTMPSLMHVFSAGNSGTSNCNYGVSGWGNITGGVKIGKNVLAVGNVTYTDGLASSSSRGPATDGRIKPDVCAVGSNVYSTIDVNNYGSKTGTSMACPGVSGTLAQLYQAYRELNNNQDPEAGLIKGVLLNSADDLGNPGPDFSFGWGRINALRAVRVLETNQYISGTASQGATNTHTVTVPANVKQVKIMVYWSDYEAAPNASVALINNLNMQVTTPAAATLNPWVLNPAPNATTLNAPATRGVDNLNNMEQVTIDNPAPGAYTVTVNGANVPQGPQKYYLTYVYLTDEVELTYPIGGEGFVPGETETLRWDAFGNTGTFTLEYSVDNGTTWLPITTAASTRRYYDWSVPNNVSNQVRVRVTRGNTSDMSDEQLSIVGTPQNLRIAYVCPDSVRLTWNPVPGAIAYEISKLGVKYMDSIGTSLSTGFTTTNTQLMSEEWFSVRAVLANNKKGRRAIAIQKMPGVFNCPLPIDVAISQLLSPANILQTCTSNDSIQVQVMLRNNGTNAVFNFPIAYQSGSGAVVNSVVTDTLQPGTTRNFTFTIPVSFNAVGNYSFSTWVNHTLDGNRMNDTLSQTIRVTNGTLVNLPFSEDFQSFSLCGTANNCELTVCNLSNGFMNGQNTVGDDIDWRTWVGGTPSTGTGPTGDHTTGTGRYLYLESSDCFGKAANLVTPCINLANTQAPQLSFWYHMYGASMGELHVDILVDNSWILDVRPVMTGNQGNMWREATVDLSSYVGKVVNIRFRGMTGSSFTSDIALDDISVTESIDVGVSSIVGPLSGCGLSNSEQLCVRVQNFGTQPQTNVPVSYSLNGAAPVTEVVAGPIAPGASVN
ncbi:MAG: S8 family serine peptidase, partial [Hymenobacteraceae bacterium]|nr:S8 family serine peptidase [Hymenobacteraceae bacterium]MDX5513250.1 S8 family serine peptidase [Hymenobacteraceae bacterium]